MESLGNSQLANLV